MNNKLVNNQVYHVKVRSVNGTWASPYTEPGIDAIPKATKKPDPPDNIKNNRRVPKNPAYLEKHA